VGRGALYVSEGVGGAAVPLADGENKPSLPYIFLASSMRLPPLLGFEGLTIWLVVHRMPLEIQFEHDTSGFWRTSTGRGGMTRVESAGVRRASMSHFTRRRRHESQATF
jgi:hypothetical protein